MYLSRPTECNTDVSPNVDCRLRVTLMSPMPIRHSDGRQLCARRAGVCVTNSGFGLVGIRCCSTHPWGFPAPVPGGMFLEKIYARLTPHFEFAFPSPAGVPSAVSLHSSPLGR